MIHLLKVLYTDYLGDLLVKCLINRKKITNRAAKTTTAMLIIIIIIKQKTGCVKEHKKGKKL